jgi:hypothetical protein
VENYNGESDKALYERQESERHLRVVTALSERIAALEAKCQEWHDAWSEQCSENQNLIGKLGTYRTAMENIRDQTSVRALCPLAYDIARVALEEA